ncbi:MAG TPA: GIY-YIG nuclease family protein [Oscillospiraceae bacterium]|nr:GIY-YIG nuclease family protein [Oscillospiraceae bacterium]
MTAYVYIVKCADNTLYTGWTTSLVRRVRVHNQGKAAKYTRARRPVELVYWERLDSKVAALQREWEIKQLTRAEKLALCNMKLKYLLRERGDETT